MAQENPQAESHQNDQSENKNGLSNAFLLTQIQHLKRVILDLQKKHQNSLSKPGRDPASKSELDQQKLKKPLICNEEESKLAFGSNFTKQINTSFRARVLAKRHKIVTDNQTQTPNQATDSKSEQKSIIYQIKGDHALFDTQKPDEQQEEPPRTQWTRPPTHSHKEQSNDFHFRKKDYIPAIEAENKKFHKYLNTYRQKNAVLKQRRQVSSIGCSQQEVWSTCSHPELPMKGAGKSQKQSFERFLNINLIPQSSKQEVIQAGQTIFTHFMSSSQSNNFTIKKYKNCIVFSLMPSLTKAAIWYYSQELYFGNISINQEGKIEKNGPGVQWVSKRHYYEGHFINNKKNGRGKIFYDNGDQYDGQWYEGHIYGFGRYIDHQNKSYEGFWRNGQYQGQIIQSRKIQFEFP